MTDAPMTPVLATPLRIDGGNRPSIVSGRTIYDAGGEPVAVCYTVDQARELLAMTVRGTEVAEARADEAEARAAFWAAELTAARSALSALGGKLQLAEMDLANSQEAFKCATGAIADRDAALSAQREANELLENAIIRVAGPALGDAMPYEVLRAALAAARAAATTNKGGK